MAGQGLGAGLAQGLEAGWRLADQEKEQQFERGLQSAQLQLAQQKQASDIARQSQAASREQAATAVDTLAQQQKELMGNRYNGLYKTPEDLAGFYKQAGDISDALNKARLQLGGQDTHDFIWRTKQLQSQLAAGDKNLTAPEGTKEYVSPEDFHSLASAALQRPASEAIDTPGSLSPVGQGVQLFHQGIDDVQKGKGADKLLEGANALWGHQLKGLIGQHNLQDGSEITDAEFAPPTPNPNDPNHFMMGVKLTTKGQDGRIGTYTMPIMDDHGQILSHPEQLADDKNATVKNFNFGDLFNHFGATETMYNALNHPDARAKIQDAYLNGHEDTIQDRLDDIHRAGFNENNFIPKHDVKISPDGSTAIITDEAGNIKIVPLGSGDPVKAAERDYKAAVDSGNQSEIDRTGKILAGYKGNTGLKTPTVQIFPGDKGSDIETLTDSANVSYDHNKVTGKNTRVDTGAPYTPVGADTKLASGGAGGVVNPDDKAATVKALANYDIDPKVAMSRLPPAQRDSLISEVKKQNPQWSENDYDAAHKTLLSFAAGPLGNQTRFFNNVSEHLVTLSGLADAMKNGDIPTFNAAANEWAKLTGKPAPINFEAGAQLVSEELVKAVTGAAGALGDREKLNEKLDKNSSPAQIYGPLAVYKELAAAQLRDLAVQYKGGTTRNDFAERFLTPLTRQSFNMGDKSSTPKSAPIAPPHLPLVASDGWRLMQNAKGQWGYVSPDGKQGRPVQ